MKNHILNLSMLFIVLFLFSISACKLLSDQAKDVNNEEVTEVIDEEVAREVGDEVDQEEDIDDADVETMDEEYTLVYTLPGFTFSIPGGAEEGYTKDLTDQEFEGKYLAELFLMYETDAFGTDFIISSDEPGFRVLKIEQQASRDLFFNEDGSGGTWTQDGVDEVFSDWMEIEPSEDGIMFHSLTFEEFESSIPDFSEGSYEAAEEAKAEAQIETTYMAQPSSNIFRITSESDIREGVTVIVFSLLHGD